MFHTEKATDELKIKDRPSRVSDAWRARPPSSCLPQGP